MIAQFKNKDAEQAGLKGSKETKERSKQLQSTPIKKRPEEDIHIEIRVGFFAIFAFILLVSGWGWLKSFTLEAPQRFGVKFRDVAGLANNAPVNLNGVRVGVVEKIDLKGKSEVIAHLKITNKDVPIVEGSKVTIQTLGLVGAKYVEINLPDKKDGEPAQEIIPADSIIAGEDPVRTELYLNKIATNISSFSDELASKESRSSLKTALGKSGATMESIHSAAAKLDKNMEKLATATDSLRGTSDKFGGTSTSATRFFNEGTIALKDVKGVSHRMNKILDNPALTTDIKETVQLAKETADSIKGAIANLNSTLTDKPLRDDLLAMMGRLSASTEQISNSMKVVNKLATDEGLRSDIREATRNAKEAVTRANTLLNDPGFGKDAIQTMKSVRQAADNIDVTSKQLNQILGKRNPLLHMMFGRPGRIKEVKVKEEKKQGKDGEVKSKTTTTVETDQPEKPADAPSEQSSEKHE